MKLVFSRKGFDSAAGGAPSPIVDGRPTSLPIPARDRSRTTYGDLGLGSLVEQMTRGRLSASSLCHCDPMFENGRCAFGQTGTAQTHLSNNAVGVGDMFLFFGLFSDVKGRNRHHRIFGFLEVEEILSLGGRPTKAYQPRGFTIRHPHTIGKWNKNNTIYVGPGSTAVSASPSLRLTVPNGRVSRWQIPPWLTDTGLTYHRDRKRWNLDGTLDAVARGQEFIADVSGNKDASEWLEHVLGLLTGKTDEYDRASVA